jgi:thiol-disulfide isomerase/thioredoxin
MNAVSLGPFVFSNDRVIAILTGLVFLSVAEIIAWYRREDREAIRQWTGAALVAWIVFARLGFVLLNIEAFAKAPLTVFAIWQGGFHILAGTLGLTVTIVATFFSQNRIVGPLLVSTLAGLIAFGTATHFFPTQAQGRLPTAQLVSLSGSPIDLQARQGRPMVLNLWATWCPPCRREMPMMVDVAQSQDGVDIVFANQGETVEGIKIFLKQSDLPPAGMLRDPQSALMQEFDLLGLPTTLFFAADGSLQSVHTGEISRAALIKGLKDLKRIQPDT